MAEGIKCHALRRFVYRNFDPFHSKETIPSHIQQKPIIPLKGTFNSYYAKKLWTYEVKGRAKKTVLKTIQWLATPLAFSLDLFITPFTLLKIIINNAFVWPHNLKAQYWHKKEYSQYYNKIGKERFNIRAISLLACCILILTYKPLSRYLSVSYKKEQKTFLAFPFINKKAEEALSSIPLPIKLLVPTGITLLLVIAIATKKRLFRWGKQKMKTYATAEQARNNLTPRIPPEPKNQGGKVTDPPPGHKCPHHYIQGEESNPSNRVNIENNAALVKQMNDLLSQKNSLQQNKE